MLISQHAVVIGTSLAGLLAARVLAEHFERVTLVERDVLPPVGQGRRGVPQGLHVHGLMARGPAILEELFPGLTDELVARGAPLADARVCGRWFLYGDYWDRRPLDGGQETLLVSRPLLEGTIRARVLALKGVTAIEECDTLGLFADERADAVHVRPDIGPSMLRRPSDSVPLAVSEVRFGYESWWSPAGSEAFWRPPHA